MILGIPDPNSATPIQPKHSAFRENLNPKPFSSIVVQPKVETTAMREPYAGVAAAVSLNHFLWPWTLNLSFGTKQTSEKTNWNL